MFVNKTIDRANDVFVRNQNPDNKLGQKFNGPFKVIERRETSLVVKNNKKYKVLKEHAKSAMNQMKLSQNTR